MQINASLAKGAPNGHPTGEGKYEPYLRIDIDILSREIWR